MTSTMPSGDVIDRVTDVADPARQQQAFALRQHRPKIASFIQGAYDALFIDAPGALNLSLRLLSAECVARLTPEPALAAYYQEAFEALGTPADSAGASLSAAVLEHAAAVTRLPESCRKPAIDALLAAGLTDADIVTLSQLIAFVAFQARVVRAVRTLTGAETAAGEDRADLAAFPRYTGFTAEKLAWHPWLRTVDAAAATEEQMAVLDESGPTARTSPYYLTLIHDAPVLRQRSGAYNAIMYAPGGLSRSERELAALVVSMLNGCPYCASVHAQRLNQLTKSSELVERVFADPFTGGANERERELIRFARRLTLEVADFGQSDVARLRALGLSDGEILDFSHVVAIFAWANRLMQTLGEPAALAAGES